jgi:hypothetical protein
LDYSDCCRPVVCLFYFQEGLACGPEAKKIEKPKETHLMKTIALWMLCSVYLLGGTMIVICILMIIEDIKEWKDSKKPKQFTISKEVDYILSRGVKTIDRSS